MTFFAGDKLDAADLNDLLAPGWVDYSSSFTLTATTTNPTKGNSTYTAHYRRPSGSDLITVRVKLLIGSTFAAGSGTYLFLLPVAASTNSINGSAGAALVNDNGTAYVDFIATLQDSTHVWLTRASVDLGGPLDNTGPGTAWATNDGIRFQIDYEPA